MGEQDRFLEVLQDIKDIAALQQNVLSRNEIERYLSGMELDKTKLDAIYHYLSAAGIKIEGYKFVPDIVDMKVMAGKGLSEDKKRDSKSSEKKAVSQEKNTDNDRALYNRKLYRRDISRITEIEDDNLCRIIKEFMEGDTAARNKLIESRLGCVMKLASGYKKREVVVNKKVSLDEVIAEGNVGLLEGISVIEKNLGNYLTKEGKPDYSAVLGTIELEIVNAMENMLDGETNNKDWEDAVLAKTNLLHEAAKFITEEIGRVPTRMELSDYTKVSLEEIDNIRGLSKDAERVANDTPTK